MLIRLKWMIILCFSMAALQLLTLKFGLIWQRWTSDGHPSAVLLPLPWLLTFFAWPLLERILRSFFHRDTVSTPYRLSEITLLSTGFGCALYLLAVTIGVKYSTGRLLLVMGWLLCGTPFCLLAASTLSIVSFSGLRRQRWFLSLLALGFGIVCCAIMLAILELGSALLLSRTPPGPRKVYEGQYLAGQFFRQDANFGIVLNPNRNVRCRLLVDDREVWDVRYSTDEYGRRTTVQSKTVPRAAAIFFGCSFLFGEGGNDEQTIPSQFAQRLPHVETLNYGVPGWGTQHMLALLESGAIAEQTGFRKAVGIYLYLPNVHEARVVGDMDIVNGFGARFPFYELNSAGDAVHRGTFERNRALKNNLYQLLGKSRTRQLLGLNFPRRHSLHYQLTAAVIEKSRKLFQQQFPQGEFLVVVFPADSDETETIARCRTAGIQVLDLKGLFSPTDADYFHAGDGHPTPKASALVAEKIAGYFSNFAR